MPNRGIFEWGFLYKESHVPNHILKARRYKSDPYPLVSQETHTYIHTHTQTHTGHQPTLEGCLQWKENIFWSWEVMTLACKSGAVKTLNFHLRSVFVCVFLHVFLLHFR